MLVNQVHLMAHYRLPVGCNWVSSGSSDISELALVTLGDLDQLELATGTVFFFEIAQQILQLLVR